MAVLLDRLDLLASRSFGQLSKLCGVDMEDLADMVAEIRALSPKPAEAFDRDVAQTVTPDILMRPKSGGGWIAELNGRPEERGVGKEWVSPGRCRGGAYDEKKTKEKQ